MRTDDKMDEIFEEGINKRKEIWVSYMKKNYLQHCMLDFSTLMLANDKGGRKNHNVIIDGLAIDICYNRVDILKDTAKIRLIMPKITFTKMFRNYGFDFRKVTKEYEVRFKVLTQRAYKLETLNEAVGKGRVVSKVGK